MATCLALGYGGLLGIGVGDGRITLAEAVACYAALTGLLAWFAARDRRRQLPGRDFASGRPRTATGAWNDNGRC